MVAFLLLANAISFDKVTDTSIVCFNPFKSYF